MTEPTPVELDTFLPQELADGWRLACQTYPTSDCKLAVPLESMTAPQRTQVEGVEVTVDPEPSTRAYHLELIIPSLSCPQADADRLIETLNRLYELECVKVDTDVLRSVSTQLRAWDWRCQAIVRDDEVVAIGSWPSRQLGLAVDLGTTKIAGYLVDLTNGRTLAAEGIMNPQMGLGEDIITRIGSTIKSPQEGVQLQSLVVEALNELAINLCAGIKANAEEIIDAVVVGNTAMHHLFLGLPVGQLAVSPFVPAVSRALDVKARDLGVHIAPGAYVHLLPNIAGFIGADHVSALLATEAWQAKGVVVVLDIGTNTEVSLVHDGEIAAVSCASGPAFEGGHIKDGMRAARGSIERLRIENDVIQYQTIDEAPPIGICGSGVVDAVAQLHLHGIIDQSGRMIAGHPNVRTHQKKREFVLVSAKERDGHPAIVITQQDVRELQKAKAAIRTGIQVLLEVNGYADGEIDQVIIAGAFGSYIDVTSAMTLGMLPSLPLSRFRQVGNAAGMGAKLAVLSLSQRKQAQTIASQVNYIELGSSPDFLETFTEALYLGQYRIKGGNREEIN
jgi:uncharacterized 2Fe-2S/4Fe-4S cluster protein (DUF4445 family)